MPYVHIQITREGATQQQKATLIEQSTDMLVKVLGKNPNTTFVVIEEVDTDNWGVAGETVTTLRAREKKPSKMTDHPMQPSAQTKADIERVVGDYLDGLYHCDTQLLATVFHPKALYATAVDTPPLIMDMATYLPIVAQRDPPARQLAPRHERILTIDLAGPVTALVKLECSFFQKDYIDLLTFIHTDGRWQIIAKVFHYTLASVADDTKMDAQR